jgi:hypothetical protein
VGATVGGTKSSNITRRALATCLWMELDTWPSGRIAKALAGAMALANTPLAGLRREACSKRPTVRSRHASGIPAGQGLWPAFWAEGSDVGSVNWPKCGEIDMMEALGGDSDTFYSTIHGPKSGSSQGYGFEGDTRHRRIPCQRLSPLWRRMEPESIEFSFDGSVYARRTPASLNSLQQWVFDKPFFLRLNLAVGGDWPGAPSAATEFPAEMSVDWVNVWR